MAQSRTSVSPVISGKKAEKNRAIIRGMFEKGMCSLHTAAERSEVIAMALSAVNHEDKVLVIDYLAVGEEFRGMGTGRLFMDYIKTWAETAARCKGIVIEVEADPSSDNIRRIRFLGTMRIPAHRLCTSLHMGSRAIHGNVHESPSRLARYGRW